ncbi:hypothetical protein Acr_22g0010130 [Actinidia rufa]|uniref:Uncharacterized protein n=1 Tax=Actinidia rufa TaxID=165716 RepID=A0A7J0GLF7_9ERIC|nr:hypothetical protein Acr_22g0010130 [Actinidia rufa]
MAHICRRIFFAPILSLSGSRSGGWDRERPEHNLPSESRANAAGGCLFASTLSLSLSLVLDQLCVEAAFKGYEGVWVWVFGWQGGALRAALLMVVKGRVRVEGEGVWVWGLLMAGGGGLGGRRC